MACERCRDPNAPTQEYTITKPIPFGDDQKQPREFCATCAEVTRNAGFKLTGGKREAQPEASTEVRPTTSNVRERSR